MPNQTNVIKTARHGLPSIDSLMSCALHYESIENIKLSNQGIELFRTEELHNLMPYKRFKLHKSRVTTKAAPHIYGIRVKKLSDLPADTANGVTMGFDQFGNRVHVSLASKGKYEYLCDKAGRALISIHVIQTTEDDVAGCDPCMYGDTWEKRFQIAYDILVMAAKSRFFQEN